ncbi:MAG: zinc-ribbon domain-containing protein [Planctomycetota bacterium]|jgi:hypothetical protein
MNCPKCGQQNPDNVQVCTSCGSELTQPPTTSEPVNVKTSRLAIASLIFGILILFAFPWFLVPGFNSFVWPIVVIVAAILSIIFGIIALVRIALSAGRLTGKGLASIGTAIPVVLFFIVFMAGLLYKPRLIAFRMVCASNLSGIGRAMLIYNSDYGDLPLPRAGGPGTRWQPKINNWQAKDRITAFNLKPDGTGGSATISSSFYLLVKYSGMSPKSFCCPTDRKTRPFKASDYTSGMDDEDAWDFGPDPSRHYSYSYHIPYSQYALLDTVDPGMAVAADRNPWLDPYTDTTGFKWDDQTKTGGRENIKGYQKGNSGLHKREGQNILFMDNHVYFEKQSFCGVNDDNIYTYWNGSDIRQGAPPVIGSQPKGPLDSLLVNEPPTEDQK